MRFYFRYLFIFLLCVTFLLSSVDRRHCYAASFSAEGALLGMTIGLSTVHWNRPFDRDGTYLDTLRGILIGGLIGGYSPAVWQGAQDAYELGLAVAPYTMGGGALYGGIDAIRHRDSVLQGILDGLTLGMAMPGFVIGGSAGVVAGGLFDYMRRGAIGEEAIVGWGSGSAFLAGTLSWATSGAQLGQGIGYTLGSLFGNTSMFVDYSRVFMTGVMVGHYKNGIRFVKGWRQDYKQFPHQSDGELHYWFSRYVRDSYGPGFAFFPGFFKEARDYFCQCGFAEFRDLQNNWNGTFRLDRSDLK